MLLSVSGAALLALAMVLQRYALSYPRPRVPFCGYVFSRDTLWGVGLLAYLAANGLNATAQQMAPLSLLSATFTTMIVFNGIFARIFLREPLTPPRVVGSLTILSGLSLCLAGTPSDAQSSFTVDELEALLAEPSGFGFLAGLVSVLFVCVIAICAWERRYPPVRRKPADALAPSSSGATESDASVRSSACSAHDQTLAPARASSTPVPPAWVAGWMLLVYPGSLGLDEAINGISLKLSGAVLAQCSAGEPEACTHPLLYVSLASLLAAALATVWWLRIVYARYETTLALPIEYGVVNIAMVLSGLLLFNEAEYMASWQLALTCTGTGLVTLGVFIVHRPALPCAWAWWPAWAIPRASIGPRLSASLRVSRRIILPKLKAVAPAPDGEQGAAEEADGGLSSNSPEHSPRPLLHA